MKIYPKHDYILDRDLRPCERLEPQRVEINYMHHLLDSLKNTLNNASDMLTEDELDTIADAVQMAYNAVENAAHLGSSDFVPRPVRTVGWNRPKCDPDPNILIYVSGGMVHGVSCNIPGAICEVYDEDCDGLNSDADGHTVLAEDEYNLRAKLAEYTQIY